MTEHSYRILDRSHAQLLQADFRPVAATVEGSRSGISLVFDLPVIARAAGGWRYSLADIGLDRALIQPVELRLEIHRPFVPGLPVGAVAISGLRDDASRAFRIRTSWRLAGPGARSSPP